MAVNPEKRHPIGVPAVKLTSDMRQAKPAWPYYGTSFRVAGATIRQIQLTRDSTQATPEPLRLSRAVNIVLRRLFLDAVDALNPSQLRSSRNGTEARNVFYPFERNPNHPRNPRLGHPKTHPGLECNPLSSSHLAISFPSCPVFARMEATTRSDSVGNCPGSAASLSCISLCARSGCNVLYGPRVEGDTQAGSIVSANKRTATGAVIFYDPP